VYGGDNNKSKLLLIPIVDAVAYVISRARPVARKILKEEEKENDIS
jgi:hypothetical protein